jgi:hypothetical protein
MLPFVLSQALFTTLFGKRVVAPKSRRWDSALISAPKWRRNRQLT